MALRTVEFVVVLVVGMILSALIASEYLGIGVASIFISAGVILAGAIIAVAIYYILKSPVREGLDRKRRRFKKEQKIRLLKAQGDKCRYCGGSSKEFGINHMEIDHKDPWSEGGSDEDYNLQVLCRHCNGRKTNKTDHEFRKDYESLGILKKVPPAKRICHKEFEKVADEIAARKAEARARRRQQRDDEWP